MAFNDGFATIALALTTLVVVLVKKDESAVDDGTLPAAAASAAAVGSVGKATVDEVAEPCGGGGKAWPCFINSAVGIVPRPTWRATTTTIP
ncbi:hypothetical protein IWX50DRAFT_661196 [Phyllosticta citricarpa]